MGSGTKKEKKRQRWVRRYTQYLAEDVQTKAMSIREVLVNGGWVGRGDMKPFNNVYLQMYMHMDVYVCINAYVCMPIEYACMHMCVYIYVWHRHVGLAMYEWLCICGISMCGYVSMAMHVWHKNVWLCMCGYAFVA